MENYRITDPDDLGVRVIKFPVLEAYDDALCHAYSTRFGGVSEGIYASMNLGFNRGDDPEKVRENYRRLFRNLSVPEGSAVFTKQTHSVNVIRVGASECGIGIEREVPYDEVDGLVTNECNVTLTVFTSDCVPVYLYDPKKRAIGLCHAGWRGTVGGIAKITVEKLAAEYGSDPADIIAVIGPSIGPECFEVGEEVAVVFDEAYGGAVTIRREGSKPHVDLWKANALSLAAAGVPEAQIYISGLCTMCEPSLLFSHRATAGKRGSNAGFLMLRPQ